MQGNVLFPQPLPAARRMTTLQSFRHYRISQDRKGGTVELWRSNSEVVCLVVDTLRQAFSELHVVIAPAETQRDARSFQHTAQLAGALRHRHLLGVLEGGEDEGANYYVTEFLDGERLDTWLARCNPLPPWLALQLAAHLVDGLTVLAQHPTLLGGVDLFNAGITLLGDSPDDLVAKICDIGLPAKPPAGMDARKAEARAIEQAGRLLLYMLTGQMQEGPADKIDLSVRPLAPELGFLLGTIFLPAMQHHPRTIEQLRVLLDRCMRDLSPELAARPDRLAPTLRPRLPLQNEFPPAAQTAEALGEDFTVDARLFDAADPYRHRGTQRDTRMPVNIQLLPPDRLIPRDWARLMRQAAQHISPADHPNLLRIIFRDEEAHPDLLVEEWTGRHTLHTLLRIRGRFTPEESALVLDQLEAAVRQAEACGLTPQIRSPRHISVRFTGASGDDGLPAEPQLAVTPLEQWPSFRLCVRTWPVMLNFSQPERFSADRLIPRDPSHPESAARQNHSTQPPTSRDFALLAAWMMGGLNEVPEKVRPLIYDSLGSRTDASPAARKEFLDRLNSRLGRGTKPAGSSAKNRQRPAADPELDAPLDVPPAGGFGLFTMPPELAEPEPAPAPQPQPAASRGKKENEKNKTKGKKRKTAPVQPAAAAPVQKPSPQQQQPLEYEDMPIGRDAFAAPGEETGPAPGLAEALFGPVGPAHSPARSRSPEPAPHPFFGLPADLDDGPRDTILDGPHDSFRPAPYSDPLTDPPKVNKLLLLLLVLLIASFVAGVAAHLSGLAFWR